MPEELAVVPTQEETVVIAKKLEELKDNVKRRRKAKTPKAIRKKREGGTDRDGTPVQFEYVDRGNYQIWLDTEFPNWRVEDVKCWTTDSTENGITQPIGFNVSLTLIVIDKSGIPIKRFGIGTATVSHKELSRSNSQLLKYKYSSALTDAIKCAAGWNGAFFDLRMDEEKQEAMMVPPTTQQIERFNKLLDRVPPLHRAKTLELWSKQNATSAEEYIKNLEGSLAKLEEKQ